MLRSPFPTVTIMPRRRFQRLTVLADPLFCTTALAGSLIIASTAAFAPLSVQLAVVGIVASAALALLLVQHRDSTRAALDSDVLRLWLSVAKDEGAFALHERLAQALVAIIEHNDPLFRSLALQRMGEIAADAEQIASGTILFEDTETWRLAYEELLRSPGLYLYRSAALVNSPAYWRDEPGRRSMRLNYEMQQSGTLSIERTIIITDELWPWQDYLPAGSLRHWIEEQHNHGIWIRLVRLSALAQEPNLQADFGIYGSRAVGIQQLNPQSKTLRFVLSFGMEHVRQAEARWERLTVYAGSYRDLLERPEMDL